VGCKTRDVNGRVCLDVELGGKRRWVMEIVSIWLLGCDVCRWSEIENSKAKGREDKAPGKL
jgi:hypothetical protein